MAVTAASITIITTRSPLKVLEVSTPSPGRSRSLVAGSWRARTRESTIWRLTVVIPTIAGMATPKRLILVAGLNLLWRTVWTLLAIGVILCLRTLLRRIASLSIRWRISIATAMKVSVE